MTLTKSSLLFGWTSRGGTIPYVGGRPTHSRNSAAKVADVRGEYYDAIINTPRFTTETDKATSANERRAMMLLEMARTNSCLYSRDLTNAAWSTAGTTGATTLITPGLDGSVNGASAVNDNDAATFYGKFQSCAIANDGATHVVRWWVTKDGGAGSFPSFEVALAGGTTPKAHQYQLHKVNGTVALSGGTVAPTARVIDDGSSWIVELTITNNTTGNVTLRWTVYGAAGTVYGTNVSTATGGVIIGNVNVELNQSAGSSPIFTTSAAVTRATDGFYWSYTSAPQAKMVHLRFTERGTVSSGSGLFGFGDLSGNGPRFLVFSPVANGAYRVLYQPVAAGANYIADAAGLPAIADTVDLIALLTPAGQIRLIASIGGAPVSDSGVVAGAALPGTWSDTKLQLGQHASFATGVGSFAEMKVVKYADVVAATAQGIMDELRGFEFDQAGNQL